MRFNLYKKQQKPRQSNHNSSQVGSVDYQIQEYRVLSAMQKGKKIIAKHTIFASANSNNGFDVFDTFQMHTWEI